MKHILFTSVLSAIICLAGCFGDEGSGGGDYTCSFTVSGDYSGTYNGDLAILEAGYNNYICDPNRDGLPGGYPQVTVSIKTDYFNGAGEYDLSDGSDYSIKFFLDEITSYWSDNTSTTCTAVFTSDTEATFQCTDIPEFGGTGSVSITGGSFSY